MCGAVIVVALTAASPQSRVEFLVGLALWWATCAFLASVLRNFASNGAALAGFTAAIIFANAVNDPGNTFHLAACYLPTAGQYSDLRRRRHTT
jgi:uncharacterized membrane protein YccC